MKGLPQDGQASVKGWIGYIAEQSPPLFSLDMGRLNNISSNGKPPLDSGAILIYIIL